MDEIQIYNVLLNSNDRMNKLTSANDAEFCIDWGSILNEGKYRVKYSICKQLKPLPPVTIAFYSSGSFTVPSGVSSISEIFLIAGGGGSGSDTGAGGAGGEYKLINNLPVNMGQTYAITIGSGGIGVVGNGLNGGSSSFGSLVTCRGGQGGSSARSTLPVASGLYGNTAGGGAVVGFVNSTPTIAISPFFTGGNGSSPTSTNFGGSGAGCNGNAQDAQANSSGLGGIGVIYKLIGYGGGGTGGAWRTIYPIVNGTHGAGTGANLGINSNINARANSGAGAGGNNGPTGGNGGSGICLITYQP
jgi:hypothetical protein